MSKNRPIQVSIWLTEEESEFVEERCEYEGMTRSSWLRKLVLKEMRLRDE